MRRPKAKRAAEPTDQRLARIYGLIDDLWSSGFGIELPMQRLFQRVTWGDVEPDKVKRMMAALFEANKDPDFPDAEDRREALSRVADDEHRLICACCRSDKKTIGRAA